MPLKAFSAETMKGLATDAAEVIVEAIRDNPGGGERTQVHDVNASLAATPIPV
ncbi:hypothetical protein [Azospirillum brasilense]|uniref:hypothetical protein n=1 Tax=Azospirillum brasilense TaxID=192 RepID=UPI003AF5838C